MGDAALQESSCFDQRMSLILKRNREKQATAHLDLRSS